MSTRVAPGRFALLAQLPALPSLEEKMTALARAAQATVACSSATVVVFGGDRTRYADSPAEQAGAFRLREGTRGLRRLLLPSIAKFAREGCYYVPHDASRALSAIAEHLQDSALLVVPLETKTSVVGAIVFSVESEPAADDLRELRTFADIAAWMIVAQRESSLAEREAKQSALLAQINERARKSLDRQSILESVVEDVRRSFGSMRCVIYARDAFAPEYAAVLAAAEGPQAKIPLPHRARIPDTWLERVFGGTVVSRENVEPENPRDAVLLSSGSGSAIIAPLVVDGRVEYAISLQAPGAVAFDDLDMMLLASVASHVGLALSNVQLYDAERARRARAESLERVVRMLRDTQTIEEVLLVFAVTVSHEIRVNCGVYAFDAQSAERRALRCADRVSNGFEPSVDAGALLAQLENNDFVTAEDLPAAARTALFANSGGIVAALRIDGALWGFTAFGSGAAAYDWQDAERRAYLHTLISHLELALAGAIGFERVQHLARALSESNAFKDDLLAMLAHDFKGPLTVILGYCELMLETAPQDEREELETIYSQTQRLVRLADDAVALAQTQSGFSLDRATLDLRDVVSESVKAHNRGNERILLQTGPEPVPVSLDTVRFNHVLDNLLMNALKYSQGSVSVRVTAAEGNAAISISDRGIGIPRDELATVFSRFGRATNARRKGISGSGVGLYVSRKIVEVHGGTIAVQSVEGEGSTFSVTLPLAGQPNSLTNGI